MLLLTQSDVVEDGFRRQLVESVEQAHANAPPRKLLMKLFAVCRS
jgi:hypothetical protein